MDAATIRGPHLPAYEVDALAWVAQRLEMASTEPDGPVTTEIVTGEDAILLRFASGAERTVYVDSEPRDSGGIPVTREVMERVRRERDEAEDALGQVEYRLDGARKIIDDARALLERIEESYADLPAWLRDSATAFLDGNPAP